MEDYFVGIKSDFLVKKAPASEPKTERGQNTPRADGEQEGERKGGGRNKKRPRDVRPATSDRLCSFVVKSQPCPFKDKCPYSHDPLDYLSRKPEDIGERCYQFDTFGWCANGIMCRFGSSHIDKTTGTSLTRSEEEGGFKERTIINNLSKSLQIMLRKRTYDFSSTKPVQESSKVISPKLNCDVEEEEEKDTEINSCEEPVLKKTAVENPNDLGPMPKEEEKVVEEAPLVSTDIVEPIVDLSPYDKPVKLVDFSRKVYVAPLTTVGNLPFRRILKEFGADITCGEMAMASNLLQGQSSEWALLRRHPSEDIFGVQIAGGYPDQMSKLGRLLSNEIQADFLDLNCGCPIDVVCNKGAGSQLLNKHNRLVEVVKGLAKNFDGSITIKVRTGWDEKNPTSHKLIPLLQQASKGRISAIMMHGRSRLQRYHRLANWEYVLQCARAQNPSLPRIPIIGNGDIFSFEDWKSHQNLMTQNLNESGDSDLIGLCDCAMIGRGALIKPWLPMEIKEERNFDISASERLEMLKKFCNYGLEHWGSDQQGVNTTRRFLLEWLSFLHRYVPVGLTERTQRMNQRPPYYFGRCDLETLMASSNSKDWIRISEMLLGPVPDGFSFVPKHKSNSYAPEAEALMKQFYE